MNNKKESLKILVDLFDCDMLLTYLCCLKLVTHFKNLHIMKKLFKSIAAAVSDFFSLENGYSVLSSNI